MIAIKNWFLRKNRLWGFYKKEIKQVRETEKTILVKVKFEDGHLSESWIPKSVIIDEWEKDTSLLGYHDYLVKDLQSYGIDFMSFGEWKNR